MNKTSYATFAPSDIIRICRKYPRRLIVPAALVTGTAILYAIFCPPTWQATQALFVRNEATSEAERPGKFHQPEDRKVSQETVLEMAKSDSVLTSALKQVGPPANHKSSKPWPTAKDVETLREAVKVTPPKGAEFGTTEVFYVNVKDRDRNRAIALTNGICDQLESHFKQLRNNKAQSVLAELDKTVAIAESELAESTNNLSEIERKVGTDLAELRILHNGGSDASDLRHNVVDIETQLRQAQLAKNTNSEVLELLQAAKKNPENLLATPNDLLESQPSLRRLKDGLIDAILKTSDLQGSMSEKHPVVRNAKAAEKQVAERLHSELDVAIRGLESQQQIVESRIESLQTQLADAKLRVNDIVGVRAEYSKLVSDVEQRTALVEQARKELADARASLVGARTSSLIGRIDGPTTGSKPVAPRRALIVLFGLVGGIFTGAAVVFITVPQSEFSGASSEPSQHTSTPSNGDQSFKPVAVATEEESEYAISRALAKVSQSPASVN